MSIKDWLEENRKKATFEPTSEALKKMQSEPRIAQAILAEEETAMSHITHFDDCGCKSAKYEAEVARR